MQERSIFQNWFFKYNIYFCTKFILREIKIISFLFLCFKLMFLWIFCEVRRVPIRHYFWINVVLYIVWTELKSMFFRRSDISCNLDNHCAIVWWMIMDFIGLRDHDWKHNVVIRSSYDRPSSNVLLFESVQPMAWG